MPPVEAEREASWPWVMVVSSSWRKEDARARLVVSKAFLASRSEAFWAAADLVGFFSGLSLRGLFWRAAAASGKSCFRGECSSFQSSTNSWLQNMSELGRWGVTGMRESFLGEIRPGRDLGGVEGGVASRSLGFGFRVLDALGFGSSLRMLGFKPVGW